MHSIGRILSHAQQGTSTHGTERNKGGECDAGEVKMLAHCTPHTALTPPPYRQVLSGTLSLAGQSAHCTLLLRCRKSCSLTLTKGDLYVGGDREVLSKKVKEKTQQLLNNRETFPSLI